MENQICCPKCGSNQITAQKKGFSGKKAVAGAVLTGGIGLLAGTLGSNKVVITCLNCGNQFKPGEQKRTVNSVPKLIWDEKEQKHVINPAYKSADSSGGVVALIFVLFIVIVVIYCLIKA